MKALNVLLAIDPTAPQLIGRLFYQQRKIYFEYDTDWLKTGFALSPYHLPLEAGLLQDETGIWQGLHGIFNDSLPDGWGLLLMDRQLREVGVDPFSITPLDRLAWLGHRTMGALVYEPVTGPESDPLLVDLGELANNASEVYAGSSEDVLPELFRAGGSPAGARPKALVAIKNDQIVTADGEIPTGYQPWLVKFNAKDDFSDAGNIEYAYSLMAKEAGIDMPETQLLDHQYFAVQRFDRTPSQRIHFHSFGNMIGADFRTPNLDYGDLFKVVLDVTRDRRELLKAFRQMVFNIATHNRDDHSKNFAFAWYSSPSHQGQWQLTPAYDLIFSSGVHGEHTMTVAGEGESPSISDIRNLARQVGIEKQIPNVVDQINGSVSKWNVFAEQARVSESSKKTISGYLSVIE